MDIAAFLDALEVDASVLAPAPAGDLPSLMERRGRDENHLCLLCGKDALVALIIENPDVGRRWLDLCIEDGQKVYELVDPDIEVVD